MYLTVCCRYLQVLIEENSNICCICDLPYVPCLSGINLLVIYIYFFFFSKNVKYEVIHTSLFLSFIKQFVQETTIDVGNSKNSYQYGLNILPVFFSVCMAVCGLARRRQRFRVTCCLHFQVLNELKDILCIKTGLCCSVIEPCFGL